MNDAVRHFGRYQVIEEIGRGNMGIVYKASDPALNRLVAIKTLLPPSHFPVTMYEEIKERFNREARAAGGLSHPGVVTVYDVGVDDDSDEPFFAMEYIEGQTLERLLRSRGALAPDQVAELGRHLALTLAYAHQHGIIHRDLKPGNILIDQLGRARLTDFGIAHIRDSRLTRQDRFLGTIPYASPEQIRGHSADGLSEVYSLGLILYHMLTGTRVFSADNTYTLMQAILHEQPEPPANRTMGLSDAWNELIMAMLAKDRNLRPPSMEAVANALTGLGSMPSISRLSADILEDQTVASEGPPPVTANYRVTVIEGVDAGRSYALTARPAVIGREQADIVLSDTNISRRHCQLAFCDGHWTVQDLDSTNGTYMDGRRIQHEVWRCAMMLRIGQSVLSIEQPAAGVDSEAAGLMSTATLVDGSITPPQAIAPVPAPPTRQLFFLCDLNRTDDSGGAKIALDYGCTVLGRDALLNIDDPKISRKHVAITIQDNGRVLVRDLDSRNGTFVNGTKITASTLISGDVLSLGGWRGCLYMQDETQIGGS